jgi:hypothetical protein
VLRNAAQERRGVLERPAHRPGRNADGEVTHFVGVINDVTEARTTSAACTTWPTTIR